jgi:hypothetical protein
MRIETSYGCNVHPQIVGVDAAWKRRLSLTTFIHHGASTVSAGEKNLIATIPKLLMGFPTTPTSSVHKGSNQQRVD